MKRFWLLVPALASSLAPLACGGGPFDAHADASDAGGPDPAEASLVKAHLPDARAPHRDATAMDAGGDATPHEHDAGRADVGSSDSGRVDTGLADAPSGEAAAGPTTVTGTVTDTTGTVLIIGRGITILDHAGVSHAAFTDPSGSFSVAGVVPPYELAVEGDSGSSPVAYMGLATKTPRVFGSLPSGLTETATVTLTAALPACTTGCLLILSDSIGGRPFDSDDRTFYPSSSVQSLSKTVTWPGTTTSANVAVQLLVADATFSNYWYVTAGGTATAGAALALGTLTPASVPSAGTLTLTSTGAGAAASWSFGDFIIVNYAGGGTTLLTGLYPNPMSLNVPDIAGTTLSVETQGVPTADAGDSTIISGFQNGIAPGTSSASLLTQAPATWIAPSSPSGTVSSSSAIAWSSSPLAPPDFNELYILHATGTGAPTYVFTAETSVSLPDLTTLGVGVAPGDYYAILSQYAVGSTLDSLAASGALAAQLASFPPNAETVEQTSLPFTLTP